MISKWFWYGLCIFSVWVTEIRTCIHVTWFLYFTSIIKFRILKKKLKTDSASSITGNAGSNSPILIFFITGVCLYLAKKKSATKHIDCNHFRYGCPTNAYWGSTIYNCKIAITLWLWNISWFVCNLYDLFCSVMLNALLFLPLPMHNGNGLFIFAQFVN